MELVNYGMAPELDKSQRAFDDTHDMACVVRIARQNDWASLGVDVVDYKTPNTYHTDQPGSPVLSRHGEFVEVYRHGVKVIYSTHGKVGIFNLTYFLNTIVQALVLLGLSVQITKLIANYCLSWEGTSQIFSRYQNTNVDVNRAKARTAALAGMQVQQFFHSLDPQRRGEMSQTKLFKNLQVMLGGKERKIGSSSYSLNPEQIAAIVRDVCVAANGPPSTDHTITDDIISMDEFCYLTGDDACDLLVLAELYEYDDGDPEFLRQLIEQDVAQQDPTTAEEDPLGEFFEDMDIMTTGELRESLSIPEPSPELTTKISAWEHRHGKNNSMAMHIEVGVEMEQNPHKIEVFSKPRSAMEEMRNAEEAFKAICKCGIEDMLRVGTLTRSRSPSKDEIEMKRMMAEKMFGRIDIDGSGRLDSNEMKALFKELGLSLSPDQEEAVLKMIDTDGSGDVCFDEFLSFYSNV